MKRQFLVLIAIAAFTTALTTSAFGQRGKTVRANVKFDFQIGDRIYPAGDYRIESISWQNDNLLQIRSIGDATKNQIFFANYSTAGKRQTEISFRKIRQELLSDPNFSRFRTMGLFDSPFPPSTRE